MHIVFVVKSVFLKCAVDSLPEVLRLKLLDQLREHAVLDCDLESVVFKLGNLSCVSHFKANFHDVSFLTESLCIPIFLIKAGIAFALILELHCTLVSILEPFFDSQPNICSYILSYLLPRVGNRVIFIFIVREEGWNVDSAWVVALSEKKACSLREPADILITSSRFYRVGTRDHL